MNPHHNLSEFYTIQLDSQAEQGGGGGSGGGGGGGNNTNSPPKTVKVAGAGIWWINDTWTIAGEQGGRPYWRRNGNKTDCLAWTSAKRFVLCS